MKARVLSALVLAPVMIALTILGGLPYLLGIAVMCGVGVWEATELFTNFGDVSADPAWRYLAVAASVIVLAGVQLGFDHQYVAQVIAALVLVASLGMLLAGGPPARRFLAWAIAAASILYVVGLGSHFLLLRATRQGLSWTILACAVTWSTDTGAFFVGRQFGHTGFFAAISAKKTAEGAAGGLAAGIVAAIVVAAVAGLRVPWAVIPFIGLSVSAVAQGGDLVESLLKREAGVKDSGTIIPGHGGALDRIDSLLFAVTLTFYWRLLFP
ncbi:MAG TPA: phosphatidate cytidylyltransferase [Chloroflexota bacterium]|nr:phosphatidate cytidylyltransferase [Chloroflexota bacterium]